MIDDGDCLSGDGRFIGFLGDPRAGDSSFSASYFNSISVLFFDSSKSTFSSASDVAVSPEI